mgnify:CR=1 FL=1
MKDLLNEIIINGGVWLSPEVFANKNLIESGEIHLKGYVAQLMPNNKILWLMPDKGARDWKLEKKRLKDFFKKVKFANRELDSLEVTLPKKSDNVEVELVLTGKMEM